MKKKLFMLLLAGCMVLGACGKKEETSSDAASTEQKAEETGTEEEGPGSESEEEEDTTPISDKTIEEEGIDYFMALGEYKGIKLTKLLYEVTENDIDNQIQTELSITPLELTDPEATVALGDVVNIKFEGKVDGEVFDGGSADSYDLTIGSGSFIDDFEDQLIGWKTGETGEVNVTFPEDYQNNTELQGKDAVFTVTINKIGRILDEPTEEWLTANTAYKTVDEYRAGVQSQIEENNAATSENMLWDDAWTAVADTARFNEYPQDLMDECMGQQRASYESYAAMYGMEYDDFMEAMGITEDDLTAAAKNMVRNALIMEYICIKEAMTEDSETYQEQLKELLSESSYESKEDALADGIPEWNIDFVTKYNCVMNFIIDHAELTEETVTAEE